MQDRFYLPRTDAEMAKEDPRRLLHRMHRAVYDVNENLQHFHADDFYQKTIFAKLIDLHQHHNNQNISKIVF